MGRAHRGLRRAGTVHVRASLAVMLRVLVGAALAQIANLCASVEDSPPEMRAGLGTYPLQRPAHRRLSYRVELIALPLRGYRHSPFPMLNLRLLLRPIKAQASAAKRKCLRLAPTRKTRRTQGQSPARPRIPGRAADTIDSQSRAPPPGAALRVAPRSGCERPPVVGVGNTTRVTIGAAFSVDQSTDLPS